MSAMILVGAVAPAFAERLFAEGWAPVELGHFIIPLAASIVAVLASRRMQPHQRLLKLWTMLLALGCFYIAGEEHSWGQHFFNWQTPESWAAINVQNETNLHNASAWANHKPRAVIQIGIFVTVIILPVIAMLGALQPLRTRLAPILPQQATLLAGASALFWLFYEEARKSLGLPQLVPRESEAQETFIYLFLLIYALGLLAPGKTRRARTEEEVAEDLLLRT
ncbi:MAG TPA: hypothetical protein PKV67_14015 [Hyphomonas sp.]|nr:hypothetical protein [Hyphomonas sp.]HRJ01865.1 hypothetical protein [Hyphomonas sp.]HRK67741.1 hypothetical protein [Hyphomonas sp.]